jgi:hypothetical protein
MTLAVFVAVLILGGFHWFSAGYFILGEVPIYPVMFTATLATATVAAIVSHEARTIAAAVVLIASFAAHFWAWETSDPVLTLAAFNVAVAAYFIVFGVHRWEFAIGALYLASFVVGLATVSGLIPNAGQRSDVYVDWSHPDLLAVIGHLANVTLGAGAGDGGKRIRGFLGTRLTHRSMGLAFGYRILARARALGKSSKIAED